MLSRRITVEPYVVVSWCRVAVVVISDGLIRIRFINPELTVVRNEHDLLCPSTDSAGRGPLPPALGVYPVHRRILWERRDERVP